MFAELFESASPTYADPPTTPGVYNGYLLVPPRIYGESITGCTAFFINRENTATSSFAIHAYCVVNITLFPGFQFTRFRFDGITGEYLDRTDVSVGSAFDMDVYQSRDGSLWRVDSLGEAFEVDPLTFEEIDGTRLDPATYGLASINVPMVDRALNLIVMRIGSSTVVGVYNFTTGALIREIGVSGTPTDILPEDNRHAYVRSSNDMLNLIDYTTGDVLSSLKAPGAEAGVVSGDRRFAWDRYLRRLLVFNLRADAADGACLSTAAGYYPVPLAVGIVSPIPLRAPRVGRRTPFLSRAYGDAGEAIPGVKLTPSAVDAELVGTPPFTDNDGEAIIYVEPDTAGSGLISVSATV
jgi:hypothetical protein